VKRRLSVGFVAESESIPRRQLLDRYSGGMSGFLPESLVREKRSIVLAERSRPIIGAGLLAVDPWGERA